MNANRLLLTLPACLLAVLLLLPSSVEAQRDARSFFQFMNETRSLQKVGKKRWAQFINGQQTRQYDEVNRTFDYVEIYTDTPAPTWVRIFNNRVFWRGAGETIWRNGNFGNWVMN